MVSSIPSSNIAHGSAPYQAGDSQPNTRAQATTPAASEPPPPPPPSRWSYADLNNDLMEAPQLARIKEQIGNELSALDRQLRSSGQQIDRITGEIQRWSQGFAQVLRQDIDPIIIKAQFGLLNAKLKDCRSRPLDERALLGSDGESYHPETLESYRRNAPAEHRQRSFLHPEITNLSTAPHPNIPYVVQWLKNHHAEQARLDGNALAAELRANANRRMQPEQNGASAAQPHGEEPRAPERIFARRPRPQAQAHGAGAAPQAAAAAAPAAPSPNAAAVDADTVERLRRAAEERRNARVAREDAGVQAAAADFNRLALRPTQAAQAAFANVRADAAENEARNAARMNASEQEDNARYRELERAMDGFDQELDETRAQRRVVDNLRQQVHTEVRLTSEVASRCSNTLDAADAILKQREEMIARNRDELGGVLSFFAGIAISVAVWYAAPYISNAIFGASSMSAVPNATAIASSTVSTPSTTYAVLNTRAATAAFPRVATTASAALGSGVSTTPAQGAFLNVKVIIPR